ncbi:MAG: sulfurtransferase, partial [Cellvibrionales bacterium]|nr:sulfurtransferase [Cellvibrionales bacterium]
MKTLVSTLFFTPLLLLLSSTIAAEDLRIIGEDTAYVTTLPSGEQITITRQMTPCAKNKGWIQPLVPSPGIVPVTEMEVLNAIGDPAFTL